MKTSKDKKSNIEFSVSKIRETEFSVSDFNYTAINKKSLRVGFRLNFRPEPEIDVFIINLMITYNINAEGKDTELMKYQSEVTFNVSNLKEHIIAEGEKFEMDDKILSAMLRIAIGATRGMIAIKTAGHAINDFILPPVNPEALLKGLSFEKEKS